MHSMRPKPRAPSLLTNGPRWTRSGIAWTFPVPEVCTFPRPAHWVGVCPLQMACNWAIRVAMIGDGAVHYTISALWTAARYKIPVVFVVARNREYGALKSFAQLMNATDAPGLDLPDIDIVGIAGGYGIPAIHADSLADLTRLVRESLSGDGPA